MTTPYKILLAPRADYAIFKKRAKMDTPPTANVSSSHDLRRSVVAQMFCGDGVDWRRRLHIMNTNSEQFDWDKQYYRIHDASNLSYLLTNVDDMLVWPMYAGSGWTYNFVVLMHDSKQYSSPWDSWYVDCSPCLERVRVASKSRDVAVGIYQDPSKTFGDLRSLKASIDDGSVYRLVSKPGLLVAHYILQTFVRENVDYQAYFASTLQWFEDLRFPSQVKIY